MHFKNYTIDDLHNIVNSLYADAWMQGCSFRFIAGITSQRRWDSIYAAITRHACISNARAGRPPVGLVIPDILKSALEYKRISFLQWCNANGYDRIETATGIMQSAPWALERVGRDFPRLFSDHPQRAGLPSLFQRPPYGDIHIQPTGAQFSANASGYPGIAGVAKSYNAALYQLIGKLTVAGRILRLSHYLGIHPEILA